MAMDFHLGFWGALKISCYVTHELREVCPITVCQIYTILAGNSCEGICVSDSCFGVDMAHGCSCEVLGFCESTTKGVDTKQQVSKSFHQHGLWNKVSIRVLGVGSKKHL